MNVYQAALNTLSDDDMKEAIREMKALDEKGQQPTGALRQLFDKLTDFGREADEFALGVCRYSLYERAASKWSSA